MRASADREDLSFQSFLEHATLFLPRFNTEFVSTDKVDERRTGLFEWPKPLSSAIHGQTWRFKIHTESHRAFAPAVQPGGDSSAPFGGRVPGVSRRRGTAFAGVGLAVSVSCLGGGLGAGSAQTAGDAAAGVNGTSGTATQPP